MPTLTRILTALPVVVAVALPAAAQDAALPITASTISAAVAAADSSAALGDAAPAAQEASAPPPRVQEYSDAYRMRAKIHKYASIATLPLFATEGFLGESLYNNPTEAKKSAHLAVAGGIGALFAVNTVTGVWNLLEGRNDPNHRGRRWAHGLLMLSADAGFLATAALGPDDESEGRFRFEGDGNSRSTHRAVAFTSIGVATAGYLVMLFGGH